jgi:exosortase A
MTVSASPSSSASVSAAHSLHRQWRLAFPAYVILVAVLCYLYFDTAQAIVHIWARSDTFAHGFIVPPIVVWLVWRRRELLLTLTPTPSVWAGVLIAVAAFAWLLGSLAAVNALMQLAFVSLLILLVPALLGWRVAKAIAFPLLFLFFAVPFGEFAMPQLMEWTADFTVLALRLSGIPVYREGLQFVIPSGNWSVVEACSGIRYLIASLTVGTLFAYLNYQSTRRRVLFIAVSFLVPIFANWFRAYLIVLLGHLSGNKLAAGVDHLIYGWVFFGVVIMLMFWVGARWSEPEPASPSVSVNKASGLVGFSTRRLVATAVTVIAILIAPLAALWATQSSAHTQATPALVAPSAMSADWREAPLVGSGWQPAFQNPSAQVQAAYQRGDHNVGLYLAYYHRQGGDRKLVSSENVLVKFKDPQWAQVAHGGRVVELDGKRVTVRTAELRGMAMPGQPSEVRLVAWQLYWVNGTLTSSDVLAKAYAALFSLLGRGDDSAVIIVYALKGDSMQGDAALEAFLQDNIATLRAILRAANIQ